MATSVASAAASDPLGYSSPSSTDGLNLQEYQQIIVVVFVSKKSSSFFHQLLSSYFFSSQLIFSKYPQTWFKNLSSDELDLEYKVANEGIRMLSQSNVILPGVITSGFVLFLQAQESIII